jgi:hypothetical protein
MLGGVAVLAVLIYAPSLAADSIPRQLAVIALLPIASGLLVFAAVKGLSRSAPAFRDSYRRPVLAELASTFLVLAGAYPVVLVGLQHVVGPWLGPFGLDFTFPPLWGTLAVGTLAGAMITYPYHLWMIRRGVIRWGMDGADAAAPAHTLAWVVQLAFALMALGLMVAAVLLATSLPPG